MWEACVSQKVVYSVVHPLFVLELLLDPLGVLESASVLSQIQLRNFALNFAPVGAFIVSGDCDTINTSEECDFDGGE